MRNPLIFAVLFFSPPFFAPITGPFTTLRAPDQAENRADDVDHPWKTDPHDPRVPIAPPDTVSISMHRHAQINAALRLPDQHRVHAGYMAIGRIIKNLISQTHCLIKKLFVVHGSIIGGSVNIGHLYFPKGLYISTVRRAPFQRIPFILNIVESS